MGGGGCWVWGGGVCALVVGWLCGGGHANGPGTDTMSLGRTSAPGSPVLSGRNGPLRTTAVASVITIRISSMSSIALPTPQTYTDGLPTRQAPRRKRAPARTASSRTPRQRARAAGLCRRERFQGNPAQASLPRSRRGRRAGSSPSIQASGPASPSDKISNDAQAVMQQLRDCGNRIRVRALEPIAGGAEQEFDGGRVVTYLC